MQARQENRSLFNLGTIAGVVADGAVLGAITPIAAPLMALNEGYKAFTGSEDASPEKARNAAFCTLTTGGAVLVGVGAATIVGAPVMVGAVLSAWSVGMFASLRSYYSALKPDNPQDGTLAHLKETSVEEDWQTIISGLVNEESE